ncbi:hypothetical protein X975_06264, partial [Stegodyphus mimosarum]
MSEMRNNEQSGVQLTDVRCRVKKFKFKRSNAELERYD